MVSSLEHDHLVGELKNLEEFNPQERLEHARKRRQQQLESYIYRLNKESQSPLTRASHDKSIHFQPNISLIEASARDDAEEVNQFLLNDVSPDLQNEDGLSALHQAVIEDCADVVSVLVERGANLNIKDADLWTPLHAAVACGNYDLAKYLIDSGASLIEINTDGNMPIDLIEDNEDLELLLDDSMVKAGYTEDTLEAIRNVIPNKMLEDLKGSIDHGRDLNIRGEHGETACHIACANGYEEVLEFLLDHGVRFDIGDDDDWQPIHAAACWGHVRIIEILVSHGADLEARTKDNETPFDLTEDEEMQEMLIELKESGHKTREVKRSQSNSSRTLSVRRSSIVEKRQISLNDAKQEGIVRAKPELLHVDITTDDDQNDDSSSESSVFQSTEVPNINLEGDNKSYSADEKENSVTNYCTDQKENLIKVDDLNKGILSDNLKSNNDCVVNINLEEEKVTPKIRNSEILPPKNESQSSKKQPSEQLIQNNQNHNNVSRNIRDINSIDIEVAESVPSHNTAAKVESHRKFNDSNEMVLKKKCCVIL